MPTIDATIEILDLLQAAIERELPRLRYQSKAGCFLANGEFNHSVVPSFGAARLIKPIVQFSDSNTLAVSGLVEVVGWRVLDSMPIHRYSLRIPFLFGAVGGCLSVVAGKPTIDHIGHAFVVDIAGKKLLDNLVTTASQQLAADIEKATSSAIAGSGQLYLMSLQFAGKNVIVKAEVIPPAVNTGAHG